MTSLYGSKTRQVSTDAGFYIPLAPLIGAISAEPLVAGGPLSTASWCTLDSKFCSTVSTAGASLLKDMGKTLVSAGRTFRKIQVVRNSGTGSASTFGVAGNSGTTPNEDYLTGYIELGFEAQGGAAPTKVALFGR